MLLRSSPLNCDYLRTQFHNCNYFRLIAALRYRARTGRPRPAAHLPQGTIFCCSASGNRSDRPGIAPRHYQCLPIRGEIQCGFISRSVVPPQP
jgi:hypothetical protein